MTSLNAQIRGENFVVGVFMFNLFALLAYWGTWFGVDRDILASAHTEVYFAFQSAFPLADAWIFVASLFATTTLVRRRASALFWAIASGSSNVFLGLLDVLFNLENDIYAAPDTGAVAIEVFINSITLSLGGYVMYWAWRHRHALMARGDLAVSRFDP